MTSRASQVGTSQTDQSSTHESSQQQDKSTDLRKAEFTAVGKSNNSSKRPGAKCKHCKQEIEAKAATLENLKKHILRECKAVPQDVRQRWLDHYSSKQASSCALGLLPTWG